MEPPAQAHQAVEDLCRVLTGRKRLAILTHHNPDPDALASALALRLLITTRCHVRPTLYISGFLSRAENRAMVTLLKIPIRRVSPSVLAPSKQAPGWLLVDTQPRSTNHALPRHAEVIGAIDHHPRRRHAPALPFSLLDDQVGSTSTLLAEMTAAAGLRPAPRVATALFYGIKTDTGNLVRTATNRDLAAFSWLFPRIQPRLVSRIEETPLPAEHYVVLSRALGRARVHGLVLFTSLGRLRTSEPVAEIADYLARLERVRWVVAGGWCDGDFYLSVRSARGRRDAGALLQRIVGRKGSAGGHRRLAAARIELAHLDPPLREQTQQNLVARLIAGLGGTQANQPLLGPEAPPDWREPAEAPLAAPDP